MAVGPYDNETLRHGALVGVVAFVAGAVIIVPLVLVGGGILSEQLFEKPVASLALAYMLFHGWPIFFGTPAQTLFLAFIPAVVLVVSGYVAARRTAARPIPAHYRGAAIVFGYLPVTAVGYAYGSLRFGLEAGGNLGQFFAETGLPVVVTSVGYTGLLFPVAFGALGGYLAGFRDE